MQCLGFMITNYTDSSDAVGYGSVIVKANDSYLVSLGEGCRRFPSRD